MKEIKENKLLVKIFDLTKSINFFIGLFLGILIINKFSLNVIQYWKLEYNSIFIEYLKILLGFPAVLLFISLFFFNRFYSAVDFFIRNLRIKYRDIEASSQQARNMFPEESQTLDKKENEIIKLSKQDVQKIAAGIENLENENQGKQKQIDELHNIIIQLANRSEFFEFKYLDSALVLNTKMVLKELYNNGPMTSSLFITNIFVPPTTIDKNSERLAIHSALFVNGLIIDDGTIKVSEKGSRYLKFINLI